MNGEGGLVHWDDVEAQRDDEGHFGFAVRRLGRAAGCVEVTVNRAEQIGNDVVGDLVAREPHLERDVVFGIKARDVVEDRLAAHVMDCWQSGRSSLRRPL